MSEFERLDRRPEGVGTSNSAEEKEQFEERVKDLLHYLRIGLGGEARMVMEEESSLKEYVSNNRSNIWGLISKSLTKNLERGLAWYSETLLVFSDRYGFQEEKTEYMKQKGIDAMTKGLLYDLVHSPFEAERFLRLADNVGFNGVKNNRKEIKKAITDSLIRYCEAGHKKITIPNTEKLFEIMDRYLTPEENREIRSSKEVIDAMKRGKEKASQKDTWSWSVIDFLRGLIKTYERK